MSRLIKRTEDEIHSYIYGQIETSEGVTYSEYLLKKRIAMFEAKQYPTGKIDDLGRYQFWYDIITPRRNDEVKNLRVDSDNFLLHTDQPTKYFAHNAILNIKTKEYMTEGGYAVELKEDVSVFSGWGNVLWKRVKDGWKRRDLRNIYLTNTAAQTVHNTDVIERHELTASQLKQYERDAGWENVDNVIEKLGDRMFNATKLAMSNPTSKKYYEVYERVGEVTEKEWNEINGKEGGDENKTILAKVIVAGLKQSEKDNKYILFKEKIKSMDEVYVEAHRGEYNGRWMREGLIELLFDHQVRANDIGNQIANGLEWASKTWFRSTDVQSYQNIFTDMEDGQIIHSEDIQQIQLRMQGFDQLMADWNRNLQEADRTANSFEITRGEELKSQTPFRMGLLVNQNNNKLHIVLRQQLGMAYRKIWKDWVLPNMTKELKGEEIIRLTDDSVLFKVYTNLAKNWYNNNLVRIGSVPREVREQLIAAKVAELSEKGGIDISLKDMNWSEALLSIHLSITGENDDTDERVADIAGFLGVEQRPGVRNYLLDKAYMLRGLDIPEDVKDEAPEAQATAQGAEQLMTA